MKKQNIIQNFYGNLHINSQILKFVSMCVCFFDVTCRFKKCVTEMLCNGAHCIRANDAALAAK